MMNSTVMTATAHGLVGSKTMTTTPAGNQPEIIGEPFHCLPANVPRIAKTIWTTEVTVLSAIFIIAMVGNLCVLFAVWNRRCKRTRMHLFILHLAIADIGVAIFQVLPELLMRLQCGFHGSLASCKLVKYLQIVGTYGSTFVLVCTAMDRYLAIRYPMQTFNSSKNRVYIAISLAWLLSFTLSIPQLILFGLDDEYAVCTLLYKSPIAIKVYTMWYFVSILLIPTILLTFFYSMIASVVMKNIQKKNIASKPSHKSQVNNGEFAPRASNTRVVSRAKVKTVKMTLVIVITFIICWTPFFMVQILGVFEVINRNHIVSSVLHLLASLNSCVNPWIYMGFSGHLLGDLKKELSFWKSSSSKDIEHRRKFLHSSVKSTTNTRQVTTATSLSPHSSSPL